MNQIARVYSDEYAGSREDYRAMAAEEKKVSVVESVLEVLLKVRMFYL